MTKQLPILKFAATLTLGVIMLFLPLRSLALDAPPTTGWTPEEVAAAKNRANQEITDLNRIPERQWNNTHAARLDQLNSDLQYLDQISSSQDLISRTSQGLATQADLARINELADIMMRRARSFVVGQNSGANSNAALLIRQQLLKSQAQIRGATADELQKFDTEIDRIHEIITSGKAADLDNRANNFKRQQAANESLSCFTFSGINIENCLILSTAAIGNMAAGLTSSVLWLANQIFNLSFDISVRRFGEFAGSNGVKEAWGIIRDLVNISLVFILLYAALALILQLQKVDARRLVTHVIIAALLVNFSAFLVGVVIEGSNTLANQFYTAAAGGYQNGSGAPDISSRLTSKISFSNAGIVATQGATNTLFQTAVAALGQVILHIITIVSLIAGAIAMLVRTIALLLVIIFAPAAFVMPVLPWFNKYYETWRDALLKHAIFAPLFLFCLLAATTLVSAGVFAPAGSLTVNLTEAGMAQTAQSVMFVLLVNFLMLGGLLISQKLGVYGAGGAVGILKGMGNKTRGWLGRKTVGKGAFRLNKYLTEQGQKMEQRGRVGRGLLKLTRVAGGSAIAGGVENLAKEQKFGGTVSRSQELEARKKEVEEGIKERRKNPEALAAYISSLPKGSSRLFNTTTIKDAYSQLSMRDRLEVNKHLDAGMVTELQNQLKEDFKKKPKDEQAKFNKELREAQDQKRLDDLEEFLKDKTEDELKKPDVKKALDPLLSDLSQKKAKEMSYENFLKIADIADSKQFKAATDREDLADKELDDLYKKRIAAAQASFAALATGGDAATLENQVKALDSASRARLGKDMLKDYTVLRHISPKDLAKIIDDNTLPMDERHEIRTEIERLPDTHPNYKALKKSLEKAPNLIAF
jgi:hypothetical protein